jgi:diacylglycerol kinase (ATP)
MTLGLVRIIVNPASGRGPGPLVAQLVYHLGLRGFEVEARQIRPHERAEDLAAATPDDAYCVVSVGGDGTHRSVFAGLLNRPVPICVVAGGTENVLGKTFALRGGLQAILKRIQANRCVPMDIGMAGGVAFVMYAGVGFDAAVTRAVHAVRHGRITRAAYYAPIARLLRTYTFPPLAVTVDGRTIMEDAGYVFLGNTPLYADGMRIASRAIADDGLLDVVCYRARSGWQLFRSYLPTLSGKHTGHCPNVEYAQGRRIEIVGTRGPVPCQTDGDAMLDTPVTCTVAPKAVRLMLDA